MQNHPLKYIAYACLMFAAGCSTARNGEEEVTSLPAIPVTAATTEKKDVVTTFETLGTLIASVKVDIIPMADGQLVETYVREGQDVAPETPLFRIDPYPYELRVNEAVAQLAIDQAALNGFDKKIDRYRGLAEKDIVAKTEWDDLLVQREKAKATVALDEARVEAARLQLDRCTTKAPIAGKIGKIDIHKGQLISAGQAEPLTTLVQMNPLTIEFHVTEKEFAQIKEGTPEVELSPLCSGNKSKSAKVTFIDNTYDPSNGLLLVRGQVDNKSGCLRPGQTVRIKVPVEVQEGVVVVPQKSIRFNQRGAYVYVIKDDMTVAARQIALGTEDGQLQVVLEGLEPDEKIIMDGHLRLSDGCKVEITQ